MPERRDVKPPEKVEIQMTAMIDVVFQLLAFFLMTFKVANVEGDFNLKVPKAEVSQGDANSNVENIEIKIFADLNSPDGEIQGVFFGAEACLAEGDNDAFGTLRVKIKDKIDAAKKGGQDEPEFMVFTDDHLRYEFVLKTIEAVSTYRDERGNPQQLAKKIKLLPLQR